MDSRPSRGRCWRFKTHRHRIAREDAYGHDTSLLHDGFRLRDSKDQFGYGRAGSINSDILKTKRDLQRFLQCSSVQLGPSTRIIRLALHPLKRRYATTFYGSIMSLFSECLASELIVAQRSKYIRKHPLFDILSCASAEVMTNICTRFWLRIFFDKVIVFAGISWAETLYVTLHGKYDLAGACDGILAGVFTVLFTFFLFMSYLFVISFQETSDTKDLLKCFARIAVAVGATIMLGWWMTSGAISDSSREVLQSQDNVVATDIVEVQRISVLSKLMEVAAKVDYRCGTHDVLLVVVDIVLHLQFA